MAIDSVTQARLTRLKALLVLALSFCMAYGAALWVSPPGQGRTGKHDASPRFLDIFFGPTGPSFEELSINTVKDITQEVAVELASEIDRPIHVVVVHRKDVGPMGSISSNVTASCIVIINNNPELWKLWGRFLNDTPKEDWPTLLRIAAAHEIGHCIEKRRAALEGKPAFQINSVESETFADIFAFTYARKRIPQDLDRVEQSMIQARTSCQISDPTHATGRFLSLFETEFHHFDEAVSLGESSSRIFINVLKEAGPS